MVRSTSATTAEVELRTLGGVHAAIRGTDVTDELGPSLLTILIYLFHEARPMHPSELVPLMRPDSGSDGPEDRYEALRRAVRRLRRTAPGVRLALTRETIQGLGGVRLDTRAVDEAIDRGDPDAVARLYRGRFLEGFRAPSPTMRAWIDKEAERLERAWAGAIRRTAANEESRGNWDTSARWWAVLAARTPLDGDARARFLRARAMAGEGGLSVQNGEVTPWLSERLARSQREGRNVREQAAGRERGSKGRADPAPARGPREAPPLRRSEVRVEPLHRSTVRRRKRSSAPDLFTDSLIVHTAKTVRAKLTTPGAVARYRAAAEAVVSGLERGIEWLTDTLEALGRLLWLCLSHGYVLSRRLGGLLRRVGTACAAGSAGGFAGLWKLGSRGIGAVRGGVSRTRQALPAGSDLSRVGGRLGRSSVEAAARAHDRVTTLGQRSVRTAVRAGGVAFEAGRSSLRSTHRTGRWLSRTVSRVGSGAAGLGVRVGRAASRVRELAAPVREAANGLRYLAPGALRYIAPVLLLLLMAPLADDAVRQLRQVPGSWLSSSRDGLREFEWSVPKLDLPAVSMPEPTVPGLVIETAENLRSSGRYLARTLTGPVVAPGARIVVADLRSDSVTALQRAVALGLEAFLSQSRHFRVLPRERARLGFPSRASSPGLSVTLGLAQKLRASGEVEAIVGVEIDDRASPSGLRVVVYGRDDQERGSLRVAASGDELAARLERVSVEIRRILGEPGPRIETDQTTVPIFSGSLTALRAWGAAREALFTGAYDRAVRRAREAVEADPAFALAYRDLAVAHALTGRRAAARTALATAWLHRLRLSERERLRVRADLLALDGQYEEAILAYEDLFQRYRDDLGALKSQFVVWSMASGEDALGNLQVAFRRDPVDWPPLDRVARYLGYRRPLPDVDSLIVALAPAR